MSIHEIPKITWFPTVQKPHSISIPLTGRDATNKSFISRYRYIISEFFLKKIPKKELSMYLWLPRNNSWNLVFLLSKQITNAFSETILAIPVLDMETGVAKNNSDGESVETSRAMIPKVTLGVAMWRLSVPGPVLSKYTSLSIAAAPFGPNPILHCDHAGGSC